MPMLGLQVSKRDIDALFDSWDPDGSGQLELGELNKVPTLRKLCYRTREYCALVQAILKRAHSIVIRTTTHI